MASVLCTESKAHRGAVSWQRKRSSKTRPSTRRRIQALRNGQDCCWSGGGLVAKSLASFADTSPLSEAKLKRTSIASLLSQPQGPKNEEHLPRPVVPPSRPLHAAPEPWLGARAGVPDSVSSGLSGSARAQLLGLGPYESLQAMQDFYGESRINAAGDASGEGRG